LITGLLNRNKSLRFKIEQIKQHDWFRRRPSRTLDFVAFPRLTVERFQTFTFAEYLTELHQTASLVDEQQTKSIPNRSNLNRNCTRTRQRNTPRMCSLS